jgi:hypothetical protein
MLCILEESDRGLVKMIALSSYEYPVLFEFGFIIFYNV